MDSNDDVPGEGILEWVASAAARFGERAAVEWRGIRISYSSLDKMANQRANRLIGSGIAQGSIVALMLDDRIEMIANLLAIFRAGAVFVPLDGTFPEERLQRIVAELQPDAFIIEAQYGDKVSAIHRGADKLCKLFTTGETATQPASSVGCLIPISDPCEHFSDENSRISVDPDAIRYIYYTSGSTAEPKGIAGCLAGLSHFIQWEIETFNIDPSWRTSQFTTPNFDAYFRDVLVPLCAGSTIFVPPEPPANLDTDLLIDWIDRHEINLIHCVPSLLRAILNGNVESKKFRSLRYVLLSGEVLQVSDVKRWMEIFGTRSKLVNLYGATETTMVKFFHIVEPSDPARGFIPIGTPMRGAKALVLDDHQRVCPPGVKGEIYIRTPFRTLGYYKNPEATKQAFVQNPFTDDPNDLIYRTGDVGIVLNDGNFRFIGRKDGMVKIRGIRVELGEVESYLLSHPVVSAAVVLAQEETPADSRLIAYVVAKQDSGASPRELRDFLKQKVPDYMVPSAVVFLGALPLMPNGKVDRRALPSLQQNKLDPDHIFVAPRNSIEQTLAEIWKDIFPVERVGVHDNFFDLGGHSLLAIQVISRVRKAFPIVFPLRTLFEVPTIAGLAERIETLLWAARQSKTRSPSASDDQVEIEL